MHYVHRALLDGPAWESSSAERINMFCAIPGKKPKPKQKRLGAKRVKHMEKLQSTGTVLDDDEATAFRALAARANYLSLDRPDVSFSTKELCR